MDPDALDADGREDCAPRRVLEIFATKWTSMVLHTLHIRHAGRARSGVLHRSLPGISKKMLIQTLQEMERSGLVERRVLAGPVPAVEYGLTSLGLRFVEPVEMLYGWARLNSDALDSLRPRPTSRRRAPMSRKAGLDGL
jgi:DNA-binding HxlR family transcriptional regulator